MATNVRPTTSLIPEFQAGEGGGEVVSFIPIEYLALFTPVEKKLLVRSTSISFCFVLGPVKGYFEMFWRFTAEIWPR